MPWHFSLSDEFLDDVRRMDDFSRRVFRINLADCVLNLDDPRASGGQYLQSRHWAYTLPGSVTVVCDIDDEKETITLLKIASI